MRTVVVLMMILILLSFVFPQIWSRYYLIKTNSGEHETNQEGQDYSAIGDKNVLDQEGQDYSAIGDKNVLDCSNKNNFYCRHISELFNKRRRESAVSEKEPSWQMVTSLPTGETMGDEN